MPSIMIRKHQRAIATTSPQTGPKAGRFASWRQMIWAAPYPFLIVAVLAAGLVGAYVLWHDRVGAAACNALFASEIIVAGDEYYPPYEYVDATGVFRGYNVDVMNALAAEYGLTIRLKPMPWAQAVAALLDGQVDAIQGMFNTPQRREAYDLRFTTAHLTALQSIFVRETDRDIASLENLEGRRVAVQEGDLAHDILATRGIDVIVFPNQMQALDALATGQVDAYVGNQYTGMYNLQHKQYSGIDIAKGAVARTPYAIAVRAEDRMLHTCFDRGIRLLRKRGTLDRLQEKWFGHTTRLPREMSWLMTGLGAALAAAALWNTTLRRQVRLRTLDQSLANQRLEAELSDRARAEQRVQDLLTEQMALNQLALATSGAQDARCVFDIFAQQVCAMTDTEALALTLYMREGGDLVDLWVFPEPTPLTIAIASASDAERQAVTRAALDGAPQCPAVASSPAMEKSPAERSAQHGFLMIPLGWDDQAIGVARFYRREMESYPPQEVDLLVRMANIASVSLQNARLFQEANQRATRLAVVNRVAGTVGAMLGLDELLETIYRELLMQFHPDAFFLGLYEPETNILDYRILVDDGVREPPLRETVGKGLISWVIATQKPLLLRRLSEQRDVIPSSPLLWGTMKIPESWLGVPIQIGDRVVGVVSVQAYRQDAYDEEDAELLDTIADQVAVAIESARLYEAVRRELTERRALEDQLRQAKKMEAIGQLAGGIAHDFNNLLTVINGYSQLALSTLDVTHPIHADLAEILKSGERAAALTRQLLAFSRRQVMEMRVLDLNQVVQNMGRILDRVLSETITLELLLQDGIWTVRADAAQIEQVILNLAVNASDAMPDGGQLTIVTENIFWDGDGAAPLDMPPGAYVKLRVIDTGVGMSDAVKEHLFEPFFTTKGVNKGTGLGLATVYGTVRQSEGYILCQSEVGQGTAFDIYLPRVEQPIAPQMARTPTTEESLDGTVVLLVEDDEAVRAMVADTLTRQGLSVWQARQGKEALALVADRVSELHLVVTDVVMPEMSGPQLVRELRQQRSDLRVLFMSGYADDAFGADGCLREEVDFIQKPFTPAALVARVRQALKGAPSS